MMTKKNAEEEEDRKEDRNKEEEEGEEEEREEEEEEEEEEDEGQEEEGEEEFENRLNHNKRRWRDGWFVFSHRPTLDRAHMDSEGTWRLRSCFVGTTKTGV